MSDEVNATSQANEPLTEDAPVPVLSIARNRLTLVADGFAMNIDLESVLKSAAEQKSPLLPLFYAMVLKLSDVDRSLRRIVEMSERQREQVSGSAHDPAKLVGEIFSALREQGLAPPPGFNGSGQ